MEHTVADCDEPTEHWEHAPDQLIGEFRSFEEFVRCYVEENWGCGRNRGGPVPIRRLREDSPSPGPTLLSWALTGSKS